MSPRKIIGLVLVAAGVLVLLYRGFTYTKESHKGNIGPFDFTVNEKEHVNIPVWTGVVAVVAGVGLLVLPSKK